MMSWTGEDGCLSSRRERWNWTSFPFLFHPAPRGLEHVGPPRHSVHGIKCESFRNPPAHWPRSPVFPALCPPSPTPRQVVPTNNHHSQMVSLPSKSGSFDPDPRQALSKGRADSMALGDRRLQNILPLPEEERPTRWGICSSEKETYESRQ